MYRINMPGQATIPKGTAVELLELHPPGNQAEVRMPASGNFAERIG